MEKILKNKVAIVTGGSFGFGGAKSVAVANRGAKVVIADLLEDGSIILLKKNGRRRSNLCIM